MLLMDAHFFICSFSCFVCKWINTVSKWMIVPWFIVTITTTSRINNQRKNRLTTAYICDDNLTINQLSKSNSSFFSIVNHQLSQLFLLFQTRLIHFFHLERLLYFKLKSSVKCYHLNYEENYLNWLWNYLFALFMKLISIFKEWNLNEFFFSSTSCKFSFINLSVGWGFPLYYPLITLMRMNHVKCSMIYFFMEYMFIWKYYPSNEIKYSSNILGM